MFNFHKDHRILALLLVSTTLLASNTVWSNPSRSRTDADVPRLSNYDLRNFPLSSFLKDICSSECIEIVVDPSVEEFVKNARVTLKINNASTMRALKAVLKAQHLKHEYIDYKTLVVFRDFKPGSVKLRDMTFKTMTLSSVLEMIANLEGFKGFLLNPDQDASLRVSIERTNISIMRGFEDLLQLYGLTYQRLECDRIMVFRDQSSIVS
jgi:hypothetical protein